MKKTPKKIKKSGVRAGGAILHNHNKKPVKKIKKAGIRAGLAAANHCEKRVR